MILFVVLSDRFAPAAHVLGAEPATQYGIWKGTGLFDGSTAHLQITATNGVVPGQDTQAVYRKYTHQCAGSSSG